MPYLQDMRVLEVSLWSVEVINKIQPLKSIIMGYVDEKSTPMIENQRHYKILFSRWLFCTSSKSVVIAEAKPSRSEANRSKAKQKIKHHTRG